MSVTKSDNVADHRPDGGGSGKSKASIVPNDGLVEFPCEPQVHHWREQRQNLLQKFRSFPAWLWTVERPLSD